jgi:hypothetical protein
MNSDAAPIPERPVTSKPKTAKMRRPGAKPEVPWSITSLNTPQPADDALLTMDATMLQELNSGKGWDKIVAETMQGLQGDQRETMWPRDTLFKYLQLMETLQVSAKVAFAQLVKVIGKHARIRRDAIDGHLCIIKSTRIKNRFLSILFLHWYLMVVFYR